MLARCLLILSLLATPALAPAAGAHETATDDATPEAATPEIAPPTTQTQETDAPDIAADQSAAPETASDSTAEATTETAPPPTRAEELDALFAELKAADEFSHRDIMRKIDQLWQKSDSPTEELLMTRARKAMTSGNTDQALDHLSRLIAFAPDFAEAWNTRATVYFLRKEFGRSIADIQRTLALEPRHFGAMSGLGMILEQIEQPEQALAAYRAALEFNPHMEGPLAGVNRLEKKVEGDDI